jgi:hypothetical protein
VDVKIKALGGACLRGLGFRQLTGYASGSSG